MTLLYGGFNDKGNIHTETGADAIGMEIRAQAFAFATNDEINNMTFYNYELINRGTQTLQDTYFGQWVDSDLGNAFDDYVGCDVGRGLGYSYNGDAVDEDNQGAIGYGANPPAIGVDFFEGPYQDNDGIDNAIGIGPNEAVKGNGIGYGDLIVDNERFGMRKFLYHNNVGGGGNPAQTDPQNGIDYYNYLRGIWLDGTPFYYGGSAHISDSEADQNLPCDFMFPGDSDPLNWGTGGTAVPDWTEVTAGNAPFDRRFMQSAGPFTLVPGAVNNITVGVVYARATTGDPFASVEAVRIADDKAQSLFENCFRVLNGPDAPDVSIQELDRELILYLSNNQGNNVDEDYIELDPFIPEDITTTTVNYVLDTATGQYDQVVTTETIIPDRYYRFQGYQIYQLKDENVSPSELQDEDLSRLVAQCDIKDGVGQIVNFNFNETVNASEPVEMVADGETTDEGIVHSFRFTDDQFATGDRRLINHKTYYYMAIAYGYNNYKDYDPNDPTKLDGQTKPYKAGRKAGTGAIRAYTGIPHIPNPENGGTIANSSYGDGPEITRIEGEGNGSNVLNLTAASEASIVANGSMAFPTYTGNAGPISVKVIDPLNVVDASFRIRFYPDSMGGLDSAGWVIYNLNTGDSVMSDQTINIENEQLFPEWGISVSVNQYEYTNTGGPEFFTDMLAASISYEDSSRQWLQGVADAEGLFEQNWIRSGTSSEESDPNQTPDPAIYNDYVGIDDGEAFEGILGGTIAPYRLVSKTDAGPVSSTYGATVGMLKLNDLQSIDLVFTNDKSKWTRCPVIEMQVNDDLSEGNTAKQEQRSGQSVDHFGNPAPVGSGPSTNPNDPNYISETGMGWFPGYAIDVESGERLNMAFGEDSWLAGENGRDMMFNPTERYYSFTGEELFGGKHYIYVFKEQESEFGPSRMPNYDPAYMDSMMGLAFSQKLKVWRSCIWVGMPTITPGETLLSNDAKIKIRVAKRYERYVTPYRRNPTTPLIDWMDDSTHLSQNNWYPMYEFNTTDLATTTEDAVTAEDALDLINVVPNPYYAYSAYETSRLDNRIKIVNLPQQATIKIFNVSGTLVRTLTKDSPQTYVDWDLKNHVNIPISGGVYIIHVEVPGVGEKVLKWFGAMRPVDLENF